MRLSEANKTNTTFYRTFEFSEKEIETKDKRKMIQTLLSEIVAIPYFTAKILYDGPNIRLQCTVLRAK